MQTFLPYADFRRTARVLDDRRLGKQRVEALQVIRALTRTEYGWKAHPVVKMWRGYLEALGCYGGEIVREWQARGFADTCAATMRADLALAGVDEIRTQSALRGARALPAWLGDDAFHRSHQSALVRKDPAFYGPEFPGVPADLPYVWPAPVT